MSYLECLIEALAGAEVFDDSLELEGLDGIAFLEPLVENGDDADGRVPQRTDSRVQVPSVRCGLPPRR